MNLSIDTNQALLRLEPGETFYLKASLLQGVARFDWTLPPPHALGGWIGRMWHGCWILKEVTHPKERREVSIYGDSPRGNFLIIRLGEGERYVIHPRALAGFSSNLKRVRTRLRFSPRYWLLHHHFFAVYEGPGDILLYAPSALQETTEREFHPTRLLAFRAEKEFRPVVAKSSRWGSILINLFFSREVIWEFRDSGGVIAESCSGYGDASRRGWLGRLGRHLLGFLRI